MFKTRFHTGSSKCPQPWNSRFQTDEVLGDSQPLALVYFNQMVIFQLTQWFALLNWSNSSPLTTWGFLVHFRFLWTLWRKWLLCSVGEEFKYITNEDTECRILSLNQIFHLCLGPTGAVWQFLGGFFFPLSLWIFILGLLGLSTP